jgi:hypothetical protein
MKQVKLRRIRRVKHDRTLTLEQPDVEESEGSPYTAADLRQIHIASGVSIAAGVWLAAAPVLFSYAQAVIRWNDTIAGLLLIVLAGLRYTHPLHRFWMSWLNCRIGDR